MKKYEDEFIKIIKPIITTNEYQKRKNMMHHQDQTVYEHSLKVAYQSYKISKKLNINITNCVIAALLHDFYKNPWQNNTQKKKFFQKHGFTHAKDALENSKKHFQNHLNKQIENSILRHMFPLNIIPPKYKEGWVITISDKIVSIKEIRKLSFILLLLGFNKKDN